MISLLRTSSLIALLTASLSCHAAATTTLPSVDAQPDPQKSYWREHVHYQYPVTMAKVADGKGRDWQIAYLDVYRGKPEDKARSPVLVLLHGRGMTSASWGDVMEKPLDAGMRVIAIDLPHYGKSLPGNLHLPPSRSLQDIRDVVYHLVVRQLGIERAAYLGHSLGGQVALGYALQHPAHVDKLMLLGANGLESTKGPVMARGVRLDDPAFTGNYEKFREAWSGAGTLHNFGRTAEDVENSFYTPLRVGSHPYLTRGQALAPYIIASRAQALKGNPQELERFQQMHSWELYAMYDEIRDGDPNALAPRLGKLAMPVFVAYGLQDPAFPMIGTGNTSFLWDVVDSAYDKTRKNRAPFQIKLYDKAGHFLHFDQPQAYADDLLAFLQTGKVQGKLYAGDPDNWQPAPPEELASLPDDIALFKKEAETAFRSRSMVNVETMFHPEFKGSTRTREQQLAWLSGFVPMFTSWSLVFFELEEKGDLMRAKIEYRTSMGSFPDEIVLKRHEGKWRFFGGVM